MISDTKKKQIITFRIDDDEHSRLLEEARKNNMNTSEYIRDRIFKEEKEDEE